MSGWQDGDDPRQAAYAINFVQPKRPCVATERSSAPNARVKHEIDFPVICEAGRQEQSASLRGPESVSLEPDPGLGMFLEFHMRSTRRRGSWLGPDAGGTTSP